MRLRITIAMLEIRNRKILQSKVNICKSDVKIGDYADSLGGELKCRHSLLSLMEYDKEEYCLHRYLLYIWMISLHC